MDPRFRPAPRRDPQFRRSDQPFDRRAPADERVKPLASRDGIPTVVLLLDLCGRTVRGRMVYRPVPSEVGLRHWLRDLVGGNLLHRLREWRDIAVCSAPDIGRR